MPMGTLRKAKPPAVPVAPVKWGCPCGCRNWSHQPRCGACGEAKPHG